MTGLASTVYGVDFASAADTAGKKTWIAKATVEDGSLSVESCRRLVTERHCDSGRESAHAALAEFIREKLDSDSAIGLDFPFGLPEAVLDEQEWGDYITDFPECLSVPDWSDDDLPNEIDSADDLSAWGSQRARENEKADCVHCKRVTDEEHGAQPPYGIIGKSITFHGLKNVIAPLAADDDVTVAPMEVADFEDPTGPLVIEAYPAGTLDRLGLCRQGYKGDGDRETRRRCRNLTGLQTANGSGFDLYSDDTPIPIVEIDDDLKSDLLDDGGGDGLDAIVAAVATYRATRSSNGLKPDIEEEDYKREGYIYV